MAITYEQVEPLIARFIERDHDQIGELGRTIILSHNRRVEHAAVLLHGMTASPTQMVKLARDLHALGWNVIVPRLPRHGYSDRMTDAHSTLSANSLKNTTTQAVEIATGLGEHVTVVGFSLGGLLAAWAGQYHRVDNVVCIAPFFGVAWIPSLFSRALTRVMRALPNMFHWWDPVKKEQQMPAHGYPRYSTHAVAECFQIAHDVIDDADNHSPRARHLIMVTNAGETTVSNRAIERLVKRWKDSSDEGTIETYEFSDLGMSHDIIEPLRRPDLVEKVYPVLMNLIVRPSNGSG